MLLLELEASLILVTLSTVHRIALRIICKPLLALESKLEVVYEDL